MQECTSLSRKGKKMNLIKAAGCCMPAMAAPQLAGACPCGRGSGAAPAPGLEFTGEEICSAAPLTEHPAASPAPENFAAAVVCLASRRHPARPGAGMPGICAFGGPEP